LRYIAKIPAEQDWKNCEVRTYTFKSANDEEADVIPMEIEASLGAVGPASESRGNYNDDVN